MSDTVTIRPAEPRDLHAVYAVCLKTGDAGRDATEQYDDPDLIGHIYAGPYVIMGGLVSFVAEDSDGIVGYAVGAADTRGFEEQLEQDWWPSFRKYYPEPTGDPASWTMDERRIWSIHHPSHVPEEIVQAYPAHIHMNLLPRAQGKGIGSRLLEAWLAEARRCGAGAVHAGVSAVNSAGLAFWTSRGFEPVATVPDSGSRGTIWCGRQI
ncbi:GNAT family N-acetyltransferase [Roseibium sediminicola]|uniref:GNAT family N-acetyltransferase n=1 Tax=Roseibium sediminicola TaxID=2933272 RepID=A0ABT0GNB2_9HYPH|nr:GNAT family N-acetyltransferase [Roseibium sp. CAU 1639]MCK7610909.1 GNAT family N-acetyltransferase [Roseibium sp. CAU 1639]